MDVLGCLDMAPVLAIACSCSLVAWPWSVVVPQLSLAGSLYLPRACVELPEFAPH